MPQFHKTRTCSVHETHDSQMKILEPRRDGASRIRDLGNGRFRAGPSGAHRPTTSDVVGEDSFGSGCPIGVVALHLLGPITQGLSSQAVQDRHARPTTLASGTVSRRSCNPLAQDGETKNFGSLPMVFLGGVGLRSATRTSTPAFWASRSDSLAISADVTQQWLGEENSNRTFLKFCPPTPPRKTRGARKWD